MSVNSHDSHVVPTCAGSDCEDDAQMVVAFEDAETLAYCFPCGNAVLYTEGGIEYPLEEYYTQAGKHVSQYNPQNIPEFDLFDPDKQQTAWVHADNRASNGSSVHPHNWC